VVGVKRVEKKGRNLEQGKAKKKKVLTTGVAADEMSEFTAGTLKKGIGHCSV